MEKKIALFHGSEKVIEHPVFGEEMENACKMKVLLRADGKIGNTWFDAH